MDSSIDQALCQFVGTALIVIGFLGVLITLAKASDKEEEDL